MRPAPRPRPAAGFCMVVKVWRGGRRGRGRRRGVARLGCLRWLLAAGGRCGWSLRLVTAAAAGRGGWSRRGGGSTVAPRSQTALAVVGKAGPHARRLFAAAGRSLWLVAAAARAWRPRRAEMTSEAELGGKQRSAAQASLAAEPARLPRWQYVLLGAAAERALPRRRRSRSRAFLCSSILASTRVWKSTAQEY